MRFKQDRTVPFADRPARTLSPSSLGVNPSGWTIKGDVVEDYYEWINYFEASHPDFGWVKGDYEVEIVANSKEAFEHFSENHPPDEWDYADI